MSYARGGFLFTSLSLALVLIGCSSGDPSSSDSNEVGQSESDLVLRRLCAGPQGFKCQANQYCATSKAGRCPDKATYGVCTARPQICPQLILPVCGCDGSTYGNSCFAAAAGVAVAASGKCEPKPQFCGGIAGIPCPSGQTCIDDPSDNCDPKNGGADCGGICVDQPKPTFCGGIAGIPCPSGQTCIDDPSDDCDPKNGGADCGGICVTTPTNPCAVVLCLTGTQCINRGGVAVCEPVPIDPCATVRCKAGTQCVNQGGSAVCLPAEPCGNTTCTQGLVCCNPLRSICTKPGMACIF